MILPDVQNERDLRGKRINKVGIRELIVPILIKGKQGRVINTVADFSVYSSLNKNVKGVSMSRFIEIIHESINEKISIDIVVDILNQIKKRLKVDNSYVKMRFNYFVKKKAPVTKKEGYIHIPCVIEGRLVDNKLKLYLTVEVFYSSCCPCSKEISKYGAHNQKSSATITVELDNWVAIETLYELVESNVSSEIYSVLKRPDEKYVTEKAYDNAMFVEDVARNLSLALDEMIRLKKIKDYVAVVNHFESIHQHVATAIINCGRDLK